MPNLHVNDKGEHISYVSDRRIILTPVILNVILGITPIESISVYKKKGQNNLDGFPAIAQLRLVRGLLKLETFATPSTTQVIPMAHLLFRICITNVCPMLGTKSNFSCQDVTIVAMLLSGKGFDLSGLILSHMMEVFKNNASTSLPYGLLLTKIFEVYGVEFTDEDMSVPKEFMEKRVLLSRLHVDKRVFFIKLNFLHPQLQLHLTFFIVLLKLWLICSGVFPRLN